MGKIQTYPLDSNVTGSDILIGTDVDDNNATKNFSVNALAAYINATAGAVDLQAVTQIGATTNINVTLANVAAQAISGTTGAFTGAITGGSTGTFVGVVTASSFTGNYVQLDTVANPSFSTGRLKYNSVYQGHQSDMANGVGQVIGQQSFIYGVNTTGGNLTAANCQVVKIDSLSSNLPAFELATTTNVYGIVAQNMADTTAGYIITQGLLVGVNASGSLQGETWANGDYLYNSNSVPGQLTKISNDAVVGRVLSNNATTGVIYVDVDRSTGAFSGPVTGTTGTFSGAVTGGPGSTFDGSTNIVNLFVSGAGNFSNDVSGNSITSATVVEGQTGLFTGAVSVGSLASSGSVAGTTGTFSGAVSGTMGAFSGAVSGTTGTFSGAVSMTNLTASGLPKLTGLSTYANNAAAIVGGLVANDVYKTASGELRIVV
jgi:hypothetical protein